MQTANRQLSAYSCSNVCACARDRTIHATLPSSLAVSSTYCWCITEKAASRAPSSRILEANSISILMNQDSESECYWPKIIELCSLRTNNYRSAGFIDKCLLLLCIKGGQSFFGCCFFQRRRSELIWFDLILCCSNSPMGLSDGKKKVSLPMFFQKMDFQTRHKGKEMSVLSESEILFFTKTQMPSASLSCQYIFAADKALWNPLFPLDRHLLICPEVLSLQVLSWWAFLSFFLETMSNRIGLVMKAWQILNKPWAWIHKAS